VVWLLALVGVGLDAATAAGGAVLTLIASAAAWLVGKAVASIGPATVDSGSQG
jgi:hypothetical protein